MPSHEFTFEEVAKTDSGLPGQAAKCRSLIKTTVNGESLNHQHWNDGKLRDAMMTAAQKSGHIIKSITSGAMAISKDGSKKFMGGVFLTATPL